MAAPDVAHEIVTVTGTDDTGATTGVGDVETTGVATCEGVYTTPPLAEYRQW